MFEESVGSPNTRPPDLLARLTVPVLGLILAVALTITTYSDAVMLASGATLGPIRGRNVLLKGLMRECASALGVRGTIIAGAVAIAIQIVLIGRAIREPK